MNESGAEANAAGGLQIVDVGGAHHYFLGLQVEIIVSGDVDFAVRLVVADEFGAEDGVPLEAAQSGQLAIRAILPLESGAIRYFFFIRARPSTESGQGFRRRQT